MSRKITKRQQQIYDFIRSYQKEKGYPPSVREMAAAVGLSSPSTVHAHLSALEEHGLIRRDATKPRALEVFNSDGSSYKPEESTASSARGTVKLPLVGRVAAGMPFSQSRISRIRLLFPRRSQRIQARLSWRCTGIP